MTNDILALIANEYKRASLKFGECNNSSHESYAVIKEEYDETIDEMQIVSSNLEQYWKAVKSNDY